MRQRLGAPDTGGERAAAAHPGRAALHASGAARLAVAALCVVGCAPDVRPASRGEREAYLVRRGALTAAETTRVAMRGRYALYRIRLASSTGMVVTGRLLVPSGGTPPFAAVLLNDGRELNSRAVEALPADFGDVVALSVDYPEAVPYDLQVRALVQRQGELRGVVRRIPPAFSLAGRYLAQRTDVDSARVALVATSFAVPFAVIAAAADGTFRNVALIYGAGDFPGVLAANLALRPAWLRTPAARLAMRSFAEFAPERFVSAISPRPLLMVNGIDDPQMPASAVRSLYAAAREPKSQIWLRTGHLSPDDSTLIRALVDTTLANLPVLRSDTAPAPRRGSTRTGTTRGNDPAAAFAVAVRAAVAWRDVGWDESWSPPSVAPLGARPPPTAAGHPVSPHENSSAIPSSYSVTRCPNLLHSRSSVSRSQTRSFGIA